ncbi:MAG: M24 family metallopeptidase [Cyanobacteriota bacterium]
MRINFQAGHGLFKPCNSTPNSTSDKINVDKSELLNKSLIALNNYGSYIAFKGKCSPSKTIAGNNNNYDINQKLSLLREEMKKHNLDALIVSSSDSYLNEFVDRDESQREYISDFTGSVGDVLITQNSAHVLVDFRYYEQADKEVNHNLYTVEKIGLDPQGNPYPEDENNRMATIIKKLIQNNQGPINIGYDPDKVSIKNFTYLKHLVTKVTSKAKFIPTEENLVDSVRGGTPAIQPNKIIKLAQKITGETSEDKLKRLAKILKTKNIDTFIITNLSDIAYITNLRGYDIPYNSTFKAKAIFTDGKLHLFSNNNEIKNQLSGDDFKCIKTHPLNTFDNFLIELASKNDAPKRFAFNDDEVTAKTYFLIRSLVKHNVSLVEFPITPIAEMRILKNKTEMKHFSSDIRKTDRVFIETIEWLNSRINSNEPVTEKDLQLKVEEFHKSYGATRLSFPIIPATGSNTEIAHYMTADPDKFINIGDLILLDTGAFYSSGLSTDQTRTWIAGGSEGIKYLEKTNPQKLEKIKKVYSVVTKAILAVMNTELAPGTAGKTIDKMVEKIFKEHNLSLECGIGHGLGICVHEFPPFIHSCDTGYIDNTLKEGMVFAIEPGYYEKDFGGIRHENIVTVRKHSDKDKANKGWHEIECLSFAPFDENLLDKNILNEQELKLIAEYNQKAMLPA